MGDGTKENPYTREDVLRLIEENGGTAKGLKLSGKYFKKFIDLNDFNLNGVELYRAYLKRAHFNYVHLEGANLREANLEGAVLTGAHLKGAKLWRAYLKGANLWCAHLEEADLRSANLENAELADARFSYDTKLENVEWGNYILGEERAGRFLDWAEDTYRRLNIWYTEHGIYNIAGEFFFREMTARRKALKWQPNPLPRAWSKFLSLICGYGERPLRVIVWAASVVLGLAAIYYFLGSFSSSSFWDTLYYSAASFTALGYGNWAPQPTGWAKGMGAAEAFIGVFTIALFLVTFIRKMTR